MPIVDVVRRHPTQGRASVLFEVRFGLETWLMKVPRARTVGAESMSAREWIYSRLAERLGLPVAPVEGVVPFLELDGPEVVRGQDAFTATPLLELGEPIGTWSEIADDDRARLVFWENATAAGWGDKIRSVGPRDFYHWAASPRSEREGRIVMLDYESLPTIWNEARAGRSAEGVEVVEGTAAAAAGIPLATFRRAAEEALWAVDDDAWWAEVLTGARVFLQDEPPDLRPIMRARIENTWIALGLW